MNLEQKIKDFNQGLKLQGGAKIFLVIRGNYIWGRGTLPSKPWLKNNKDSQQYINLGKLSTLSDSGFKFAVKQVKIINGQLLSNSFSWEDWVTSPKVEIKRNLNIIDIWQNYYGSKVSEVSRNTVINNYMPIYRWLTENANINLDLNESCQDLITKLKESKSKAQLKNYSRYLQNAINYAIINQKVSEDYRNLFNLDFFKNKKNNQISQTLTIEEKNLILNELKKYNILYYNFFFLAFNTGMRPSEITALKVIDIKKDFIIIQRLMNNDGTIKEGLKTQNKRVFPLNEDLKNFLLNITRFCEYEAYIFTKKGKPLRLSTYRKVWDRILLKLSNQGVERRNMYHTRHFFISNCLDLGIPVATIAQWVGNSPQVIFEHYAHNNTKIKPPTF
jgi:integrase